MHHVIVCYSTQEYFIILEYEEIKNKKKLADHFHIMGSKNEVLYNLSLKKSMENFV